MENYWLCFTLQTDATFGRGEGLAGVVDQEVDYAADGLPYLGGRTLKGLLNEECANILFALSQRLMDVTRWTQAAQRLWGGPGSTLADDAGMRVGDACLPEDLRQAVSQSGLSASDVLDSLTTIRRQTAVDEETGAPEEGTLRAMRVILRQTSFEAALTFLDRAEPDDLMLLAACALAFRRAGTGRNRGRGCLQATLHEDQAGRPGPDITRKHFDLFAQEVRR